MLVTLSPCVYPLTYHLFCRFPTGQHPGGLWQATQWLLYALFVLVFWPAWILHYLGVDIGARATQFLVDHPSMYLIGYRVGATARAMCSGCCASCWRWSSRRAIIAVLIVPTAVAESDWSLRD